jgi:hypothetical protein
MQTARNQGMEATAPPEPGQILTAQELLAGSLLAYDVVIPASVLRANGEGVEGRVRIRPLKLAALALISKAAREDPSLVPLLMIKDSLVEPSLSLEQIRMMHVGLLHFLVSAINRISGLGAGVVQEAATSAVSEAHVLLARHFGWTPAQVAELTPGQVALYLAGVERLLALDAERKATP